uniref:Uncharacterized protein n=1 Tax=Arundo donax TaxID=35708 RepID=A0A0A9GVQ9_ARUDO
MEMDYSIHEVKHIIACLYWHSHFHTNNFK